MWPVKALLKNTGNRPFFLFLHLFDVHYDFTPPPPYDTLFDPGFDYERAKRFLVGAVDFDRENGLLYIVERRADENDNSVIHVFRVEP